MFGGGRHVLAAILDLVPHRCDVDGFHRTRFCRCLNARHPVEWKRQANHESEKKSQVVFHAGECSRWQWLSQFAFTATSLPV